MKTVILLLTLFLLLSLAPAAAQQDPPPENLPPRYVLTLPPGHELVEVGEYKAICEPGDRAWVEKALRSVAAATPPATMPTDLLTRLASSREAVLQQFAADYALDDTAPIAARLEKLAYELQQLDAFRPPLFYFCTTPARLKGMLKEGRWTNPGLYYNRVADDVSYRETLPLTVDRPMDDTVITVLFAETEDEATRIARLHKSIANAEEEVSRMVSGRAMFAVQSVMLEAALLDVFDPIDLPVDQRWIAVGLSGATSADYAQLIIGSPRRELLLLIAAELRNNPIKPGTIDLLNPPPPDSLRPRFVPLFADSYRRKSISVALRIIEPAREKLPELVSSLRADRPRTAAELIERIRVITGVDVSESVRAR